MTTKVYHDLREQLDQYSVGFPSTDSGVELKILQKLFTEEEALTFLSLSILPEDVSTVAQRNGKQPEETAALLERMYEKGLIFRMKEGERAKYAAVPFVVGSFEMQVKDMDRELAELYDRYLLEGFGKGVSLDPPLRPVPVNKSIEYSFPVEPYENVKEIIKQKDTISVAKCICRVQRGLIDQGCDKPLETCFGFDFFAHYLVEKSVGRYVSTDEALEIIDKCEEAGLVPQPTNDQDVFGMCNCCGDCCGVLRSIKLHPRPAEKVLSNYFVKIDPEACAACGTCSDRCQMDAIKVGEAEVAEVDLDRCIGCGLCVSTCPSTALSLQRKPESERKAPPATERDYTERLTTIRGTSLVPLSVIKRQS